MRHLDARGAGREQATLREDREHGGEVVGPVAFELAQRHAPAHHGPAGILAGQAQHHRARQALLAGIEAAEGVFGQPCDGATDASRAGVRGVGQAATVSVLPELQQRRREQREAARLTLDVADQRVDQVWLGVQPDTLRRQLDRLPQLVAAHRAHQHLVGAEQPRQPGIRRAASVEVGSQGDDHQAVAGLSPVHQSVDERHALALVPAGGEDLLELIDGQHGRATLHGPQLAHRALARPDDDLRPVGAPGEHAGGQARQQAGLDD